MTKGIGAWDGTNSSFWDVIEKVRQDAETEGDLALLGDVVRVAMAALETMERLQALGYGEDLAEIAERDKGE